MDKELKTVETISLPHELMMVSKLYTPSTGSLLLVIYTYYEQFGKALQGNDERIAEALDLSTRTIKRAILTLKQEELVEISNAGKKRKIKPNFNFPWKETFWEPLQRTWKIINGEEIVTGTVVYNSIAIDIVKYWNSKQGLYPVAIPLNHGDNRYEATENFTKLIKKIVTLMSGKMFNSIKTLRYWHDKPWSEKEVKVSIDNFHLAATDADYAPVIKKSPQMKRLLDFIYSPFATEWKAPIIIYQDKPKFSQIKNEEVKFPGLYSSLKEEMVQTFTKGRELRSLEDMKIIVVSNRIGELIQTDYKRYLQTNLTSTMWAGYIVEALLTILRRDDKNFSVFSTVLQPWFLDRAFPQFLMKKGILSEYPLK